MNVVKDLLGLGISATGFLLVAGGVAAICAVLVSPLARRYRDTDLLKIRNPIELGWASTARLLRPALVTLLGGLVLNVVLRLFHWMLL